MKDQLENHREHDQEIEKQIPRWIEIGMWPAPRTPIMDPMQKTVLVWAAIGFVIAVFYIALCLMVWYAVSWIGSISWIAAR